MVLQHIITRFRRFERKWVVLTAVGVGAFVTALDSSVVNIILPVLTHDFSSSVATMEWVITVYLLVVSSLLLTFGRLGDLRGHRRLYLLGFTIFISGSALCGAAPSVAALIIFRGLQALGAAMLFSNSLAILTLNFPARQRGQALGMSGMLTYTGLTIGPSLGGWLTDRFSWRAVFYINIPVGLIALLMSWRAIPQDSPAKQKPPFDFKGATLFTGGLTALLLVLDQGHSWGWTSATVLILSGASAAFLGAFFALELSHTHPMLDLTLFRRVSFSAAVASALLNYICINCALFLLPFYLVQGRGLGATQAGIILTAQPIIMAIATPLSGKLSDRLGSRLPATVGMTILAAGLLLLARLGTNSPLTEVTGALAIVGLGTGIFIAPNSSALMGSAPRERQGIAAGILATARNTGMVLGVGLAGAIFTTALQGTPVARAGAILFRATSASFLVAGGLAVMGIFVSAVRGR